MNLIPTFETKRLILKDISEKDIPAYQKHFVDYEIVSQLSSAVPWPFPADGIENFVINMILPHQGLDRWFWGIFLKENPEELIGGVDLWRNPRPENRGFWLGRKFWGKGYMTESVIPVTDYAFNVLGFDKLVFSNALGNEKSRRVKEKTGARLIGTRPAKFVDPNYSEAETWELSKEDWEKFKTATVSS